SQGSTDTNIELSRNVGPIVLEFHDKPQSCAVVYPSTPPRLLLVRRDPVLLPRKKRLYEARLVNAVNTVLVEAQLKFQKPSFNLRNRRRERLNRIEQHPSRPFPIGRSGLKPSNGPSVYNKRRASNQGYNAGGLLVNTSLILGPRIAWLLV
ncbi:10833_t:CDS:1, partial [Acaulospora colombiana]